jgi:peptidoglycan DL-endopeptidase LytE
MMRRRIFLWMGLSVLFTTMGVSRTGIAQETGQAEFGDAPPAISEKIDVALLSPEEINRQQSDITTSGQDLITPSLKDKKVTKPAKSSSPRKEIYSVRKGDTLARIAKNTGFSVSELRDLNHLKGSFLKIGQKLTFYQNRDRDARSASTVNEYAKNEPLSELEEEEDGGIAVDQAWAEIERQKKENESLLGNWSNSDEPRLLVKVAMGFLGAPYRLGGSSVTGIDCSAFVKKIYQFFNITLPRTAYEQSHVGLRVARGELVEGDLLFFNTRRKLGHVGIYIGNNEFVHASSRKRGVRIDNLNMPYFDRRFVRAVRLKGSDGGL